ncbi:Predicted nucleotidyltransferase [Mariniphaga anaerophila]|uniref:Predicted nucleotidyltransferase n=1 Tax=Mariniphaga anaerophila TaxID=1484053 RepID=A0A1M5E4L1_9BACT|nr:nucleotidyltransferase domain-containing protein [Mariniphaga anaerophila]SHF74135.1 Predicted nucleotidyltransferase [Mariniphaga anaerophila]
MLDRELETKIIDFLRERFDNLSGLYVFGSYATDLHTSQSDLELAFLSPDKISVADRRDMQKALATLIDINIDLIDLKEASVVLRAEILKAGKQIYSGNSYECDKFEMVTYSMYADISGINLRMTGSK